MLRLSLLTYIISCLLFSCKTEEQKDTLPTLKEGQTLKYNNEYLKIIDEDNEKDKPARLINAEAPLRLGQLNFTLNSESFNVHTFKKGYTSLHLSEKGARILLRDMNNTSFQFFIRHTDVLSTITGTYPLSSSDQLNTASIELTRFIKGDTLTFKNKKGTLYLTKFNPRNGQIELRVDGQLENIKTKSLVPLLLDLTIRIEDVTSNVVRKSS